MKQEDILLKLNALYDTDVLEHFPKEYLYLYNTPIDKIEEEGKISLFLVQLVILNLLELLYPLFVLKSIT